MVSEDRLRAIEANRSLRTIRTELESLLEKGFITEDVFDEVNRILPADASSPAGAISSHNTAASTTTTTTTTALSNLSLSSTNGSAHPPPSYAQTTGSSTTTAPPALPSRNGGPAKSPSNKPILCHARALYRYAATDTRDVALDRDDRVAVHEYMNADWWMGRNLRTGAEGIFPKSYVEVEQNASSPPPGAYADEKRPVVGGFGGRQGQGGGGYPAPPPAGGAYQRQQQQYQGQGQRQDGEEGPNKFEDGSKKFGKKLGNAAIFGAGATLGSKIVGSIF